MQPINCPTLFFDDTNIDAHDNKKKPIKKNNSASYSNKLIDEPPLQRRRVTVIVSDAKNLKIAIRDHDNKIVTEYLNSGRCGVNQREE